MPRSRFSSYVEARLVESCRRLRRRGFLSTIGYLAGQLLRELGNTTREFDPPPSIGTHKAVHIVNINIPHNYMIESYDGNGEIGFHLFYADPDCNSTWQLSSKHPGPRQPFATDLGAEQRITLLSDAQDRTTVWAYECHSDSICPYSVFQTGGKVRGKCASGFEVAIVTDDWKMHHYHEASLHNTVALQGSGELVGANVFSHRDALLEYTEPERKSTSLIWLVKQFNFYGQEIYSPHTDYPATSSQYHVPLLGPRYRLFHGPLLGYDDDGAALHPRLLITGADYFLRLYYFPGTGSQWTLLKYNDGTLNPLSDYYHGDSMAPWDVIPSPGNGDFDGHGEVRDFSLEDDIELWIVGNFSHAVKILRITIALDIGQYTVQEDTTYAREEAVADVMWYRGSRRLIHLELELTGKLRIVFD